MIPKIQFGDMDARLRQKMLERQVQQRSQAHNIQAVQPNEQTSGVYQTQKINQASGAIQVQGALSPNMISPQGVNPQGSNQAATSAIGENPSQMRTQATDFTQNVQANGLMKQDEGNKSVAANMPSLPEMPPGQQPELMTGATQLAELNKYLLIKKNQSE